jgi:hypothetical protein
MNDDGFKNENMECLVEKEENTATAFHYLNLHSIGLILTHSVWGERQVIKFFSLRLLRWKRIFSSAM